MKVEVNKKVEQSTEFSKYTDYELAEAFIFPSTTSLTSEEIRNEEDFWKERRELFQARTSEQKMYDKLLQLKFQLEDYVKSTNYDQSLNFGYFLNEYLNRQNKKDKQFAAEIDVNSTALSQYLNNHRKPTEKFVIRLEIHSNGIINALSWFKLLQKDKEYAIMTDSNLRSVESKHVKNKLEFAFL